jgi:hypothetical protein
MASFDQASQAFIAWLSKSGAEISHKIHLEDLRHLHAGRGVGTLIFDSLSATAQFFPPSSLEA